MSGSNIIGFLLMVGLLLTACQTTSLIPDAYNFKAREVQNNPYGCWTILEIKPEQALLHPDTIAGELLFIDADTLYLLASDKNVLPIFFESILNAELYTHRNMGNEYLKNTAYFMIPGAIGTVIYITQYGGRFLIMGIPVVVTGVIISIIESSGKHNVLKYPEKNSLESLAQFARFPAGRPLNIKLNQMKLKPDPASLKKPKK